MKLKQETIESIAIAVNVFGIFMYIILFIGLTKTNFYSLIFMPLAEAIIAFSLTSVELIRRKMGKPTLTFARIPILFIGIIICCIAIIHHISIAKMLGFNFLIIILVLVFSFNIIVLIIPKKVTTVPKQEMVRTIPIVINSIIILLFFVFLFKVGFSFYFSSSGIPYLLCLLICPFLVMFESIRSINDKPPLKIATVTVNNIGIGLCFIVIAFFCWISFQGDFATKLIATAALMFSLFNIVILFYQKEIFLEIEKMNSQKSDSRDYRVPREKKVLYTSLGLIAFTLFIFLNIHPVIVMIIIVVSIVLVKVRQGQLLGQSVKVSKDQLPEVYETAKLAAERLSMKIPDVFVRQDPVINAFALGFFGKKSVVLNSKTVESMTKQELLSILGHEFSHIRCGHTNWIVITSSVESVKIPIISDIMGFTLLIWSRMAEFTADRGGVLASRNLKSSVSALAKVAVGEALYKKLNLAKFIDQGKEVDTDLVSRLSVILSSHPYIVKRIVALENFFKSDIYNKIIN
jgi:Zn-dependent protease with chaperone function